MGLKEGMLGEDSARRMDIRDPLNHLESQERSVGMFNTSLAYSTQRTTDIVFLVVSLRGSSTGY